MDRLGLEVVDLKGLRTTTSLKIPKELPTVEETSALACPEIDLMFTLRSEVSGTFLLFFVKAKSSL